MEEVEKEDKKEIIVTSIRLAVCLALSLMGLFWLNEANFNVYVNLAVMVAAYLVVGYDIIIEAVEGLIKEKNPFNENMLMLLASIGAFALRAFGKDEGEVFGNEFFEAVMIAFLYQVGELFEDLAEDRSHKAITEAVGLRAKYATLISGNELIQKDPKDLNVGDRILVKVGEIIPADGEIEEGGGDIDMSSLTGEFNPVYKNIGESVNSGTILRSGSLTVKVSKSYEDSTVSKIIALVEESEDGKSKADRFITKFAKIYTPIVVSIAILLAVIPPLFLGISDAVVWKEWIKRGVSLLVISCPCAIVVSVPLAYFAGIGLSSQHGIIVKGASYFDKLNELGILVTDKTGTLTYGKFQIEKEEPIGVSKEEFDEYLHAAESRSNHPIAKAILRDDDASKYSKGIESYDEISGKGIKISYKGHEVLAGNKSLLDDSHITSEEAEGATVVYLAIDGKYAGYVSLFDTPKEEAKETVASLKEMNISTMMLTGDKKESALKVSEALGIETTHYELLPEQKTAILKETIESSPKGVAYVGDGINDAPSIVLSDVGFAMGGAGSDLAIENADIVIMNDDISKVVTSIKIAKATRNRAIFNVVATLVIKLTIAILACVIANFPLMVAVFADTGTTLLMVLSSMLLLSKKIK